MVKKIPRDDRRAAHMSGDRRVSAAELADFVAGKHRWVLATTRADGRPLPIALHQDYLSRPKRRGASFAGDRGRIDWRLDDGTLTLWGTDGNVVEKHDDSAHPRNQLFLDELSEFLTAVRTRRPAGVSLDEGVASLRIALALRASQASGKPAVPKEL